MKKDEKAVLKDMLGDTITSDVYLPSEIAEFNQSLSDDVLRGYIDGIMDGIEDTIDSIIDERVEKETKKLEEDYESEIDSLESELDDLKELAPSNIVQEMNLPLIAKLKDLDYKTLQEIVDTYVK